LPEDEDWLWQRIRDADRLRSKFLVLRYHQDFDHNREPAFQPLDLVQDDDWTMESTIAYLEKTIGCMSNTVTYLHNSRTKHKDLKPSDILLPADDLWVTDFGSATDSSVLKSSVTDNGERGILKYSHLKWKTTVQVVLRQISLQWIVFSRNHYIAHGLLARCHTKAAGTGRLILPGISRHYRALIQ
jgi:serine/threonine protein kinase